MRNDVCKLISTAYVVDNIGQRIPTETQREVFCGVRSVSGSEFFSAGQNGIKASLQVTVDIDDYQNEKIVEVEGVRYGIYRTYRGRQGEIELYLEEKAGV